MASSFHLLVALPNKEPTAYSLTGAEVTLGRSPVNDIQLLVREVSTQHCKFNATDAGYEIEELGSTNGTKVNDQPLKENIALNHHDRIILGETIPAYVLEVAAGSALDATSAIAEIEAAAAAPKKPTVKPLTAPGAIKKVGLATKKPMISAPLPASTPAAGDNVGSATIKLPQPSPSPTAKFASPPVKKLVPPGAPNAAPAAKKLPALTKKAASPPVKKLVPPGNSQAPPAVKKLAIPGQPLAAPTAQPAPSTAPPAAPPTAIPGPPPATPSGKPKLAVPSVNPPEGSPKIALPAKKAAPKLNLPKKED